MLESLIVSPAGRRKRSLVARYLPALLLMFLPLAAQAHPGHGSSGFEAGFAHPIGGLDHLLAMVAVGIWAAQLGGRARWCLPASFLGAMMIGGAMGVAQMSLPLVEPAIMASVVMLGGLIAMAARLPLAASAALVGLLAIFHGYAHGAEMPANAGGLGFGLGFVLATAALHASGVCAGQMIQRSARVPWVRLAGSTIAVTGVLLFVR